MTSYDNTTFVGDSFADVNKLPATFQVKEEAAKPKERESWGNGIEFLLSCIAMSVGLGNVWRFPFVALENGGGSFVIPYLIVLFLIGRPIYFMEMVFGQLSSRGGVKVFDCVPVMRGIGVGQVILIGIVGTYYSSLLALTLKYLVDSFSQVLPWSECSDEWTDATCIAASYVKTDNQTWNNATKSSAELYFT